MVYNRCRDIDVGRAMETINATDLARHTGEILDWVAGRGETVMVTRNRKIIARIMPVERTMTAAQALAGLSPMLTPKQAAAWLEDSMDGFDETLCEPSI